MSILKSKNTLYDEVTIQSCVDSLKFRFRILVKQNRWFCGVAANISEISVFWVLSRFSTSEYFRAKRLFFFVWALGFHLVSAESSRTKGKSRFARKYSLVENRLKCRSNTDIFGISIHWRSLFVSPRFVVQMFFFDLYHVANSYPFLYQQWWRESMRNLICTHLKLFIYLRSFLFDFEYESKIIVPATAKIYMNNIKRIMINAID